jgi:hypothetical protein
MNFDEHGHLVCAPTEVYQLAVENPDRLLNAYLMVGTPLVFAEYSHYCGIHLSELAFRPGALRIRLAHAEGWRGQRTADATAGGTDSK